MEVEGDREREVEGDRERGDREVRGMEAAASKPLMSDEPTSNA